jgi:hypothetical protein
MDAPQKIIALESNSSPSYSNTSNITISTPHTTNNYTMGSSGHKRDVSEFVKYLLEGSGVGIH